MKRKYIHIYFVDGRIVNFELSLDTGGLVAFANDGILNVKTHNEEWEYYPLTNIIKWKVTIPRGE